VVDAVEHRRLRAPDLQPVEIERSGQQPAFAGKDDVSRRDVPGVGGPFDEQLSLARLQGMNVDVGRVQEGRAARKEMGQTVRDLVPFRVERRGLASGQRELAEHDLAVLPADGRQPLAVG
jgi:hypothetical protein